MATMNVSLPDSMKRWIEVRIQDDHFSNTSDYIRHLIRRDKDRKEIITKIQKEIDKGVKSGAPEAFDFETFRSKMEDQYVDT